VCLGEGCQETQREQEVGDASRAADGYAMLNDVSICGAQPGDCSRDEARVVCDGGTTVGDLHGAAVRDGLEEP
jgi:hypothetical protein